MLKGYAIRTVAYWIFTIILANELLAGAMWALLRITFDRAQFAELGYPLYMLWILGTWKLAGGIVVLLPRFQRAKEWAYAGAFFDFSGGVVSQLVAGHPNMWMPPALYAIVTIASWALRPETRRLASPASEVRTHMATWLVPIGIIAAFLVLSLLTLPKGMSPSGSPAW